MQCRTLVAQLGRLYPELQASGAEVLIILGEPLARTQDYAKRMRTPFAVLSDAKRDVFHLYDLHKALLVIQRTAALVLDKKGVIRYHKNVTSPFVWLQESEKLLETVRDLQTN